MNGGAMVRYLKVKDRLHFALQYNGQAAVTMNNYPQKLEDAYTALIRSGAGGATDPENVVTLFECPK